MMNEVIEKIKAKGFQVYARGENPTYAYFTNGNDIGYIEDHYAGLKLSTVHMPSRQVGTGFSIGEIEEITKSILEQAFIIAPHWAKPSDRSQVKKYSSWESFHKSNSFNSELTLR